MPGVAALTGGTGFIGGRIIKHLIADGWRVRALARADWAGPVPAGLTVVRGSLEDRDSLDRLVEGCTAVVHSAGAVRARSAQEFLDTNARGAGRLAAATAAAATAAAAAAAATGSRPIFLHLSSLAARAPNVSPYARSKKAGEDVIAANIGDVRWLALRPPAVYGPGDRAILDIFRSIELGFAPMLGSDDARVSLIFVDDLAAAVAAALTDPPPTGSIFEISDGAAGGYSWRRIGDAAARARGRRIFYLRIPKPILQIAAAANAGVGLIAGTVPMLTQGKVRELCHPDWACLDNPLTGCTKWRPQVGIDDGFARTLAWYRGEGWV